MALQCSLDALAQLDRTDPDAVQALLQTCVATLLDPRLWAWALYLTLGCGLVGALIGHAKGRWLAGLVWGAALGPIGWLVVALQKPKLPECPECSRHNLPQAKVCRHCGVNLRAAALKSERAQRKVHDRGRGW